MKTQWIHLNILPKHSHNCQKTHTLQNPEIQKPQSYHSSVTRSWEPQTHNSGTEEKYDLTFLENENNSPDRLK